MCDTATHAPASQDLNLATDSRIRVKAQEASSPSGALRDITGKWVRPTFRRVLSLGKTPSYQLSNELSFVAMSKGDVMNELDHIFGLDQDGVPRPNELLRSHSRY